MRLNRRFRMRGLVQLRG